MGVYTGSGRVYEGSARGETGSGLDAAREITGREMEGRGARPGAPMLGETDAWVEVTGRRRPGEAERRSAANMRWPAIESVPMIRMRITHTMTATKTGTILFTSSPSIIATLATLWLATAIETPHQVRMAFMVAASSHAPNRYQTSFGSSVFCWGVNRRAMPAKSMPQK